MASLWVISPNLFLNPDPRRHGIELLSSKYALPAWYGVGPFLSFTVVDNQGSQIRYLGGNLMER